MTLEAIQHSEEFRLLSKSNASPSRARRAMSALRLDPTAKTAGATDVKITMDAQSRTTLAAMQRLEKGVTLGQKAGMLRDAAAPQPEIQSVMDKFTEILAFSDAPKYPDKESTLKEGTEHLKGRARELRKDMPKHEKESVSPELITGDIANAVASQVKKLPAAAINPLF